MRNKQEDKETKEFHSFLKAFMTAGTDPYAKLPESVVESLKNNPLLFFKKCDEIDDCESRAYPITHKDVSAAHLVLFYNSKVMLDQVTDIVKQSPPDILNKFATKWHKIELEQHTGTMGPYNESSNNTMT